ncbi:transcription factor IBH1-like 1 [Diospyros lotus]|uniref:transcription factor IBH1-like 1 n=1 Tax=Diospyros lotus TaxID=55363 RepID=UPI00224D92C6|nr:transcription factor IBH1-like 1 [Diospyros lotus]
MRSPSSLKQDFLKKWVMGLQFCGASKEQMGIFERKKAIKLSADVAMASARNARTSWSRALIANASKDSENKALVDQILGTDSEKIIKKASVSSLNAHKKIVLRSKKILKETRRSRRIKKMEPQMAMATSVAKRLVKKRTQVLKRLIPGGESMDEFSLIEETLDYIASLRAQVDVMRHLVNASEVLNGK